LKTRNKLTSEGIIVPPAEYFKILGEIFHRYDIKVIVDEVITGFGRTGSLLAINQMDLIPDVLTLGKGMSSGYCPGRIPGHNSHKVETQYNTAEPDWFLISLSKKYDAESRYQWHNP
jgi:adenosylmethionine-8-amino-7-oxononanoate aminotransferase